MKRDSSATRARIFQAASAEFARYGVAGARVDRIAANARANKARIYEYFGDKEQLFETVLEEELHHLTTELPIPLDPEEIPEFVGRAFDYHRAHPELVRLLHWEALHFLDRPIPGEAPRRRFYRDRAERLRRTQESGHTDPRFDPRHLHFVLVTLATSWFALPQLAGLHIDGDPFSRQAMTDHRKLIVEIVEKILRPESGR